MMFESADGWISNFLLLHSAFFGIYELKFDLILQRACADIGIAACKGSIKYRLKDMNFPQPNGVVTSSNPMVTTELKTADSTIYSIRSNLIQKHV